MILLLALLVQDQVDNPEYKAWASFKPGSTVTYKVQMTGKEDTGEQKSTLKSVGDAEVVVEQTSTSGTIERKVPAKISAADSKKLGEGDEELEIAGKKMATHWTQIEKKLASGKVATVKVWAVDDVPGRAVKIQMTSSGTSFVTMTATAWEKK